MICLSELQTRPKLLRVSTCQLKEWVSQQVQLRNSLEIGDFDTRNSQFCFQDDALSDNCFVDKESGEKPYQWGQTWIAAPESTMGFMLLAVA